MKQYAIVIDLDRCIGCRGGCQVACKTEHGIGLGPSRSTLYTMGPAGVFPDLEMYFLPVMCQQCKDSACIAACPTGACRRSDSDGVVRIDHKACIGCRKCMKACPYHAVIFRPELKAADKCDLCSDRRAEGLEPGCVTNCAGNAILYGDVNDAGSAVYHALKEAEEHGYVYALPDGAGVHPSGRFILRSARWQEPDLKAWERKKEQEGASWKHR